MARATRNTVVVASPADIIKNKLEEGYSFGVKRCEMYIEVFNALDGMKGEGESHLAVIYRIYGAKWPCEATKDGSKPVGLSTLLKRAKEGKHTLTSIEKAVNAFNVWSVSYRKSLLPPTERKETAKSIPKEFINLIAAIKQSAENGTPISPEFCKAQMLEIEKLFKTK